MSTLKCQECGHENETQRVYCHSCGARLDRASLIEEAKKPQKVVKPRSNGQGGAVFGTFISNLLKTIIFGGIFACLIQASRPPKDAPSGEKELGGDIVDAPSLSVEMDEALATQRRIGYSEAQLDAYLKNKVKPPKNPQIPPWAITYDSSYIRFQNGSFKITKKLLLFSQPVYVGGTYLPVANGTSLTLKNLGGNIGSLSIPAPLYDLVDDYIFSDFVKNMKEEAGAAAKMRSIEATPKMIILTPGVAPR